MAAAVCLLAWTSLGTSALPPPAGASAPLSQFSAARAFVHVRALARTPRPTASSMNAEAREYILASLRGMGLQSEVQRTTVQRQSMDNYHNVHVTLAVVHNIVVRKSGVAPGHANAPALLVATHYDSEGDTLGAADGAAGSAAMLETLRALQAGPPLANDAVFLFADGDKIGALGEQAFAEQHPLARQVGLALRFHHLGNRGPLVLDNAHGDAGEAIAAWANSPTHPHGSSLMREVYGLMPNVRGIGPLAMLKAPILQFAAVEGPLGRFDTPELLGQATLQHEGDTMLELARTFAGRTRSSDAAKPDQLYFSLPLLGMIHYSANLVWPVTRLTCLLLAGVCCLSIQRARIDPIDIVKGAFGYALIAGLPLAVLYLDGLHGTFAHLAGHAGTDDTGQRYVAGVAALLAGWFILLQRQLCRIIGPMAAALGALVWLAVALVLASWTIPGASYVLAWPLLVATAALGALHAGPPHALPRPARAPLLLAGLAPAVVLIAPAARDTFSVLTPLRMHLPLWLLAVLLGFGVAALPMIARRFAVRIVALLGLGLIALPGAAGAPPADPPRPNPLVYYKDMPTWSEWWLARQNPLDGWSRGLFPDQQKPRRLVDVFGWDSDDLWYARAGRTRLAFPYAILLVNDPSPRRHIEFDLTSKNRAPNIELRLNGGKPWRASVNDRVLSHDDQIRNWSLSLYGMEDKPLHFRFDLIGDPILVVNVEERIPGVPETALPFPLQQAGFIPMTGETIARDTLWFR
jgi:hypothetical protein